jgi:hypothetical protein
LRKLRHEFKKAAPSIAWRLLIVDTRCHRQLHYADFAEVGQALRAISDSDVALGLVAIRLQRHPHKSGRTIGYSTMGATTSASGLKKQLGQESDDALQRHPYLS